MKVLDVQNHYQVLEVSPGARPEEIDRAYRLAEATWAEGSLALYSVFDDADAEVVRERIREAYGVLSDEDARRVYDEEAFDLPPEPQSAEVSRFAALEPPEEGRDALEIALDRAHDGSDEGEDATYDGPCLRRARMQRGFEVEDIAGITKIGAGYLKEIEEEAFDSLPAAVYVRGFVAAYARAIGLDPNRVAASYMLRLEAAREGKGRGRLLRQR